MEFTYEPGRFYNNDANGQLVAEVTFQSVSDDQVYVIDHTFVREDHRGQGIAHQLIRVVVDKARSENKKIIPLCSYAKAEFQRVAEYADVLKPTKTE